MCKGEGCDQPSTEVDHIKAVSGPNDPLFWDTDNQSRPVQAVPFTEDRTRRRQSTKVTTSRATVDARPFSSRRQGDTRVVHRLRTRRPRRRGRRRQRRRGDVSK
jgi:hypothetical protein